MGASQKILAKTCLVSGHRPTSPLGIPTYPWGSFLRKSHVEPMKSHSYEANAMFNMFGLFLAVPQVKAPGSECRA